jgi:hypothetical protein
MTKYVVVPGYVYSRDGDRHFVNADQLQQLYGVNSSECLVEPSGDRARGYTRPEGAIVLHPKSNGDYSLPKS